MSAPRTTTHERLHRLCMTAIFAALIFVATAYLPRIPTATGYVHVGDALVFLAASLLPTPDAVAASALGGGLADLLTGYAVWSPASCFIKGASALAFTARRSRMACGRNAAAIAVAACLCVGGYYVWGAIFVSRSWVAPVAELLPNLMQTAVSSVAYFALAAVFDRIPVLRRALTGRHGRS